MTLDLPTLMVMQSFAMASAGAILLIAWLQDRGTRLLAVWGVAHLAASSGMIAMMLDTIWKEPACAGVGGALLSLQSGLIWKAARTIDGRRAPLALALLGPALVAVSTGLPGLRATAASIALAASTSYTLGAAVTLWHGRSAEPLTARWPLTGLTAVHAAALLVGIYSNLDGLMAYGAVPSLGSLFSTIYFESIVFALGTSVFVLALIKERREAAEHKAARLDSLTGIANRAAFLGDAAPMLERCRRDHASVCVVMFDLDRFKTVNDRYGHATGDAVLQKFCQVTAATLRPGELFGRIGGEEFAIVLPSPSIEVAGVRAERIRSAFADACRFVRGHQVNATVSGGVAAAAAAANDTLDAVLERADQALYAAKADGRNRIKRAATDASASGSNVLRVA